MEEKLTVKMSSKHRLSSIPFLGVKIQKFFNLHADTSAGEDNNPKPGGPPKHLQEYLYMDHCSISRPLGSYSTSSSMKNAHPQFSGRSASLVETGETPEERERTLMPLNPHMELDNWNTTLMSCATNIKEYQQKKNYLQELRAV